MRAVAVSTLLTWSSTHTQSWAEDFALPKRSRIGITWRCVRTTMVALWHLDSCLLLYPKAFTQERTRKSSQICWDSWLMKSITCFTLAYMMGCVDVGNFTLLWSAFAVIGPGWLIQGSLNEATGAWWKKRTKEKQLAFVTSAQQVKTVILKKSIHLPLNGLGPCILLGSLMQMQMNPLWWLCHTFLDSWRNCGHMTFSIQCTWAFARPFWEAP